MSSEVSTLAFLQKAIHVEFKNKASIVSLERYIRRSASKDIQTVIEVSGGLTEFLKQNKSTFTLRGDSVSLTLKNGPAQEGEVISWLRGRLKSSHRRIFSIVALNKIIDRSSLNIKLFFGINCPSIEKLHEFFVQRRQVFCETPASNFCLAESSPNFIHSTEWLVIDFFVKVIDENVEDPDTLDFGVLLNFVFISDNQDILDYVTKNYDESNFCDFVNKHAGQFGFIIEGTKLKRPADPANIIIDSFSSASQTAGQSSVASTSKPEDCVETILRRPESFKKNSKIEQSFKQCLIKILSYCMSNQDVKAFELEAVSELLTLFPKDYKLYIDNTYAALVNFIATVSELKLSKDRKRVLLSTKSSATCTTDWSAIATATINFYIGLMNILSEFHIQAIQPASLTIFVAFSNQRVQQYIQANRASGTLAQCLLRFSNIFTETRGGCVAFTNRSQAGSIEYLDPANEPITCIKAVCGIRTECSAVEFFLEVVSKRRVVCHPVTLAFCLSELNKASNSVISYICDQYPGESLYRLFDKYPTLFKYAADYKLIYLCTQEEEENNNTLSQGYSGILTDLTRSEDAQLIIGAISAYALFKCDLIEFDSLPRMFRQFHLQPEVDKFLDEQEIDVKMSRSEKIVNYLKKFNGLINIVQVQNRERVIGINWCSNKMNDLLSVLNSAFHRVCCRLIDDEVTQNGVAFISNIFSKLESTCKMFAPFVSSLASFLDFVETHSNTIIVDGSNNTICTVFHPPTVVTSPPEQEHMVNGDVHQRVLDHRLSPETQEFVPGNSNIVTESSSSVMEVSVGSSVSSSPKSSPMYTPPSSPPADGTTKVPRPTSGPPFPSSASNHTSSALPINKQGPSFIFYPEPQYQPAGDHPNLVGPHMGYPFLSHPPPNYPAPTPPGFNNRKNSMDQYFSRQRAATVIDWLETKKSLHSSWSSLDKCLSKFLALSDEHAADSFQCIRNIAKELDDYVQQVDKLSNTRGDNFDWAIPAMKLINLFEEKNAQFGDYAQVANELLLKALERRQKCVLPNCKCQSAPPLSHLDEFLSHFVEIRSHLKDDMNNKSFLQEGETYNPADVFKELQHMAQFFIEVLNEKLRDGVPRQPMEPGIFFS